MLFHNLNNQQQQQILKILIDEYVNVDFENRGFESNNKNLYNSLNNENSDDLSNEQLCVIYQQGDKNALETLLVKNKLLIWSRVYKLIKRSNYNVDVKDLYQNGAIGLIMAAKRFDVKMGAKVSTYATYLIDQNIYKCFADFGYTIRIPWYYFEQINRLAEIKSNNPECTEIEIFEKIKDLGITFEKYMKLLSLSKNMLSLVSLNEYIGENKDIELGDSLEDFPIQRVEDQIDRKLLEESIANVLSTLNPK